MPTRLDDVRRTGAGRRSRAKLPEFEVFDLAAIEAAEYEQATASLAALSEEEGRLDAALALLEDAQKRMEATRARRDRLVQSLSFYEKARGAKFEAAAGLKHSPLFRVKMDALAPHPLPKVAGTERTDWDRARQIVEANGLRHDPKAAEKLPKTTAELAALKGKERAALEVRDAYVLRALAAGRTQADVAARIGRIPSQVTRMARRGRELAAAG